MQQIEEIGRSRGKAREAMKVLSKRQKIRKKLDK